MKQQKEETKVTPLEMAFKVVFTGLLLFPLYEGTISSLILLFLAAPSIMFVLEKVYTWVFKKG